MTYQGIKSFSCAASTRFSIMASPYGVSPSHSLDTLHL